MSVRIVEVRPRTGKNENCIRWWPSDRATVVAVTGEEYETLIGQSHRLFVRALTPERIKEHYDPIVRELETTISTLSKRLEHEKSKLSELKATLPK